MLEEDEGAFKPINERLNDTMTRSQRQTISGRPNTIDTLLDPEMISYERGGSIGAPKHLRRATIDKMEAI